MGDSEERASKKRAGVDSDIDPLESKRNRVDSGTEFEKVDLFDLDSVKISELDSPVSTQIGHNILDILDDADGDTGPAIHDLDSVIKSFEEEILQPSVSPPLAVLEMALSDSGESQPELGYLLGASDDELGLPPAVSPSVDEKQKNDSINSVTLPPEVVGFGDGLGFDDQTPTPGYDSFDFGFAGEGNNGGDDSAGGNGSGVGEFVTLGGLFDYPEPTDLSEFPWRAESLPAL